MLTGQHRTVRLAALLRRATQLSAVLVIVTIPAVARYNNYLTAHELDRTLTKWAGTAQGKALAGIDTVMRVLPGGEMERAGRRQRDRTHVLQYGQQVRGGSWSAEIGGVSITDPLAGAETIVASKQIPWVLVAGLILPVVLTLLLGRIFCSWICPMGFMLELTDKLRAVLRFLEIHPRNLRLLRGVKYGVLVSGLVVAAILAVPVLGYVYLPAILAQELRHFVFAAFDRAEMGRFGLSLHGFSWMMLVVAGTVLVEVTVSRRWWCRYVCPGGALYSLIGAARAVRVKVARERCTACAVCVAVCPMGLNPMNDQMGIECDNCGVCVTACNDGALGYAVETPVAQFAGTRPQSTTA